MIEINNHLLVIISSVLSLYIFNFLEQSSTSYHCWTKSGLLPLLVKKKKSSLGNSHAHLSMCYLWLLLCSYLTPLK